MDKNKKDSHEKGAEQAFRLDSFLSEQRLHDEKPIEDWDPVEKHFMSASGAPFSSQLAKRYEDVDLVMIERERLERQIEKKVLEEKIKDNVFIDLGAGGSYAGYTMSNFASKMGACAYIGVDLYQPKYISQGPDPLKDTAEIDREAMRGKYPDMSYSYVHSDIFDFLAHVPDNSACICVNGLDGGVLHPDSYAFLIKELKRVCKPGGLIIGRATQCLSRLKDDPAFIDHAPRANEYKNVEMYEKIKIEPVAKVSVKTRSLVLKSLKKKK